MSVLSHWKPIVAAVLLGLAAGVAYLLVAEDRYAAEAKLLVVPRPAGDATFEGFGLPRVCRRREFRRDGRRPRRTAGRRRPGRRAAAARSRRRARRGDRARGRRVERRHRARRGRRSATSRTDRERRRRRVRLRTFRNVPGRAEPHDRPVARGASKRSGVGARRATRGLARRPADRAQSLSRRARPDGSRCRERGRERSRRLASTGPGSGRRPARLAPARPGSRRAHGRCRPAAGATSSDGGSALAARDDAHRACASRREARTCPRERRGRAGRAGASRRRSRGVGRETRVGARRTRTNGHRA